MILLVTTALAAEPDPDAIRALAERDPHAATLASVGLDVEGVTFVCEADEPPGHEPFEEFGRRWRWAVFVSDRPHADVVAEVHAGLGRPLETADGRSSWFGRGNSVWFAGNDLAYTAARVDVLAADQPRAHLQCAEMPASSATVVGITARRKRPHEYGVIEPPPLAADVPPEPPLPPDPCPERPIAARLEKVVVTLVPLVDDVLVATGSGAVRIDLGTGTVEPVGSTVAAPDARLPDGAWLIASSLGVTRVDPTTWERTRVALPAWWAQQWSPLASIETIPVSGGLVARNGFDAPARWQDGAWTEAPPLPDRLFEWDRKVLVLDDGRLLAWNVDGAELVDVGTGRTQPLESEPGTYWLSAVQLLDGRILASHLTNGGASLLTTWDLETRRPNASVQVCDPVMRLVRLASGRVVEVVPRWEDAPETRLHWVEPP